MSFDVTSNDPTFNFSIQRENSERLFEWEFGSILLNKYGKKLLQLDKTLDEFKQMGVVFNEKLPTKFNKTGKSIVVKGSINFKRCKRPQDLAIAAKAIHKNVASNRGISVDLEAF
jgi:hypothetical protein